MKVYLPSSFILRYVRADMNVHAFMNELDQKDLISKNNFLHIFNDSQAILMYNGFSRYEVIFNIT